MIKLTQHDREVIEDLLEYKKHRADWKSFGEWAKICLQREQDEFAQREMRKLVQIRLL